ncbi:MAG: ArnT family glycosyltransferase [Sulfobacillus sp.]
MTKPAHSPLHNWIRTHRHLLAGVGVVLVAIVFRLWDLYQVPSFQVELEEVYISYQIAFLHLRPLTDVAHDIGAFYNYLVAGLFWVFGMSLYIPRLVSLAFGVAVVVVTMAIGRRLGGWGVGLASGLLFALCGAAVFVSHMAFSNSVTPFAVALAGYLTYRAEDRRWLLVWAGLVWGVALQTDSSVMDMLLPLVAYLAITAVRDRRRLWPTVAGLGAAAIGYLNMIVYNIQSHLGSLQWIFLHKKYAVPTHPGLASYLQNLLYEMGEWGQTLGTAFLNPHQLAQDVLPGLIGVIALAVFVMAIISHLRHRRHALILLLTIGPLLLVPVLNKAYNYPQAARYLVPILPFAYPLIADWAWRTWQQWAPRIGQIWRQVVLVAVAVLVLSPVASLGLYYHGNGTPDLTDHSAFILADALHRLPQADRTYPLVYDSRSFRATFFPFLARLEGYQVVLMGDPWTHLEHGQFSFAAWQTQISGRHGPILALLAPKDAALLASIKPAGTTTELIPGVNGGYVLWTIPGP